MKAWKIIKRVLKRRLSGLASLYTDINKLRATIRSAELIRHVVSASQDSDFENEVSNGQVVVINSVRTYINIQLCVELIIALKLRARGYQVRILYDDGILVHHDTLHCSDHKPFRPCSQLRLNLSRRVVRQLPIIGPMLTPYSNFLSKSEAEQIASESRELDSSDIEPFVEASLVRFFLSAPDKAILSSEPDYARAREMFIKNTSISQAVAVSVFEKLKPALMLTSHGIYSTWGAFMRKMMDFGVRTISWGGNGYSSDMIDIAIDNIAANKADGGFFEHLAAKALPDHAFMGRISDKMGQMLNSRIQGTAGDIARLGVNQSAKSHPILDRIIEAKNNDKQVFALFPNVMWDNATTFKEWNRVFESPVEWLIETVRYFSESSDKLLVVRAHPAEYLWMTVRKGIREILTFHLGEEILCHSNIIFVPPEEKFSSYHLFEHLNGGTVYNGTIGPELIHAGIPLILGARAAYSDKGFTFDPKNRDDYFSLFDRTKEILTIQNQNVDRTMLFLYEYFCLHGVRLRFMDDRPGFLPRYGADPLEIWIDDGLEHAVATIVGEREFFQIMPKELICQEKSVI